MPRPTGLWMPKKMDFWEAIDQEAVVTQRLKPRPYADWVEMDAVQQSIYSCMDHHLPVLFMGRPGNTKELVKKSICNMVIREYPELAAKHNLVLDESHEYWRNK